MRIMKRQLSKLLSLILLVLTTSVSSSYGQGDHLTPTIIQIKASSPDSVLWTGKNYAIKISDWFRFVQVDSTWVDTVMSLNHCDTLLISEPDPNDPLAAQIVVDTQLICYYDTIPAHWNVFETPDPTATPTYEILGTTNLDNSVVTMDGDTLRLWLNEIGRGDVVGEITIKVSTQYDTTTVKFSLQYFTVVEAFIEIESFESEAVLGQTYSFQVQKGVDDADTTATIVVEVPDFIDNLVTEKNIRKETIIGEPLAGDTVLAVLVKGSGIVPNDTTYIDFSVTNQLKSGGLKSGQINYGLIKLKATAISTQKTEVLFEKEISVVDKATGIIDIQRTKEFVQGIQVEIYTQNGLLVKTEPWSEAWHANLTNGLYIVKQGDLTKKLAIIK